VASPWASGTVHSGALVGRGPELARFDDHLTRACAGAAQRLVVTGEAGVGKSAFLAEARRRAAERGCRVLAASGFEGEQELPYATLQSLLATVPDPTGPDRGATSLLAIGQAVLSLLGGLAARRPVVIVVDDAQWVDPASLQVLLFVAHRLDADAAVVLFARRPGAGPLDAGPFTRVDLGGLDREAVAALLAGAGVVPEVAARCQELTGGNPLALVEGAALLDADQRAGRSDLPTVWPLDGRLLGHFADQLAHLPQPTRLALALVALEPTGHRAVIDAAVRRLGADPRALAVAEEAGVVHDHDGAVTWRHPLVAAAALHGLPDPRRRELHRALGASDPDRLHPDRIAWHLASSAAGPDEDLARRIEGIALRRAQQGAFESASRAFDRAAALADDAVAEHRRVVLAAKCLLAAGRLAEVVDRLAPLVDTFADPVLEADLAMVLGQAELWSLGVQPATRRLQRHAARVEQASPERSALLLGQSAVAQLLGLTPDAARTTAGQARAVLARRPGPPDEHQAGMEALGVICAVLAADRASEPGELAGAAVTLMGLLAVGWPDASALLHTCAQAMLAEDGHRLVLDLAEESLRQAERDGMGGREMLSRLLRADCLWRLGRGSEALAEVSLVVSVGEATGQTAIASLALGQVARVEAGLGLVEPCREHARDAIDAAVRHGLPYVEAQARAALLLLALGEEDGKAAVAEVEPLAALVAGAAHPGWLWWHADAIEALHGAGQEDAAGALLDRLVDLAARTRCAWAVAAADRSRALLGIGDPVEACTRAAAGFRDLGARFDEARAVLLRGTGRVRAGDETGRTDVDDAAARFDRLGARAWQARAARATRPVEPADAPPALSAVLTSAELRVAHAVGRGGSNRQVADELYLSVKTVESHLRSIYRKLDLKRRTQLVVLMAEHRAG
jgi:DNA-binding CsgD family transcriptional regulator